VVKVLTPQVKLLKLGSFSPKRSKKTVSTPLLSGSWLRLSVRPNYSAAAADFSKVIEIEPARPEPYFRRAVEYFNLGEFKKCVADFETFANSFLTKNHIYGNWELPITTRGSLKKGESCLNLIKQLIAMMLRMRFGISYALPGWKVSRLQGLH
jgi:hypothetical protein